MGSKCHLQLQFFPGLSYLKHLSIWLNQLNLINQMNGIINPSISHQILYNFYEITQYFSKCWNLHCSCSDFPLLLNSPSWLDTFTAILFFLNFSSDLTKDWASHPSSCYASNYPHLLNFPDHLEKVGRWGHGVILHNTAQSTT